MNLLKTLFLSLALLLYSLSWSQDKIPVILDADTGNEVDDPYALARALIEPTWNVLALNATHWQTSHWAEPNSMENSHRINQVLLGHMGLNVKTRRGGTARMYDWGDLAQHSAAAYEIINQAKSLPKEQKLTVIALGALTNVASALYIDPTIEDRIILYWLGSNYDFEKGIMSTLDFNCIMDTRALHALLNSEVEMHIVNHDAALEMNFEYAALEKRWKGKHPLGDFLVDRWYNHRDGLRKMRWLWDIAIIQAAIHPEWTEEVKVTTSKDLGSKDIYYYKSIDGDKMKAEFLEKLDEFMRLTN